MSELTGVEWLNSPQNRAFEERKIRLLRIAARPVGYLCQLGIRSFDVEPIPIALEQRSLVPDKVYKITKYGRPGPANPFSNLLTKTMLDELPTLEAIHTGQTRLIGPRGTSPEHRERLFDSLNGASVDRWRHILTAQQNGTISTYALQIHAKSSDPQYVNGVEPGLSDSQIAAEAQVRFECDERDFVNASQAYSEQLINQFRAMVVHKLADILHIGTNHG